MKHRVFIIFALLSTLFWGETLAQEIAFSKETFSDGDITLPYRKGTIPGLGDKASLVIYLHGGTSKGNDNEAQMQEPGIDSICSWLSANNRKAIMLVPQCPTNLSWLGTMQDAVVRLLQTYIERGVADSTKIYIFGGSMGGTGTWNMLSNHPDFFAAAMPVAGNPTGLDASAVSTTPLFTVMGTADRIMKISNVEPFLEKMDSCGAEYKFDIEDGWTHEDVCKNSYTEARLNWVFSHKKEVETAIAGVSAEGNEAVRVLWFSMGGQRLVSAPTQKGIYVKTTVYGNGSRMSEKVRVR